MVAPRSRHPRRGRRESANTRRSPLKEMASELGQSVRNGARAISTEAKTAIAAAAEQVRDEAQRLLDEQKEKAASQLQAVRGAAGRVAHALHAVKADAAADYADAAGDALDQAAQFVEDANLDDLSDGARWFAREHPAWVIGGLFAAGFIAARVLKASADDGDRNGENGPQRVRVRRRPRR